LVAFLRVWLTYHAFSRERPQRAEAEAARRLPRLTVPPEEVTCSRRDAVRLAMSEALQRRANERPLVGCYAELARTARYFLKGVCPKIVKRMIGSVESK
jgi:hypothetical protein